MSFEIVSDPIDPTLRKNALRDLAAGAYVEFEGRVRVHARGRRVENLEYEVYEGLARKEGSRILEEAVQRFGLREAEAVHRRGELQLGEVAVWIGMLAPHRAEAFSACRFCIDAIKARLPIWKRETYVDGDSGWVHCDHDEPRSAESSHSLSASHE